MTRKDYVLIAEAIRDAKAAAADYADPRMAELGAYEADPYRQLLPRYIAFPYILGVRSV